MYAAFSPSTIIRKKSSRSSLILINRNIPRRHPHPKPSNSNIQPLSHLFSSICVNEPGSRWQCFNRHLHVHVHPDNHQLYSSASKFSTSRPSSSDIPTDVATIIQGPSLLTNTGIHRPSPSIFFLPGLRSLPFWTAPPPPPSQKANANTTDASKISVAYGDPTITKIVKHLEDNYKIIQEEYLSAVMGQSSSIDLDKNRVNGGGVTKPLQPDYDVNRKGAEHGSDKLHIGNWEWHSWVQNGNISPKFEQACPKTVGILEELGNDLFFDIYSNSNSNSNSNNNSIEKSNPFGFAFFSTLHSKSYIKPHTGPMNLRLRIHLPLIVPAPEKMKPDAFSRNPHTKCGLRVGDQVREWKEGKVVVLDDSYEHEVWNETGDIRVLLLVDVWVSAK